MKKSKSGLMLLALAACAGLLVCACTDRKPVDLLHPNFHNYLPKTVAVLPMDNMSPDLDATPLVRPIVQQRMVYKGYDCIPLEKVDAALKEKGVMVSHDVYMYKPQELGELLGADAVVYGTITEFNKHYAVVYADILVGIQMEMVDTKSGESLWKSEHVAQENTALVSILIAATQPDKWEQALIEIAAYNAAFAVLSQYRPYAEDAAKIVLASLPAGPLGERRYPWDYQQATWDNDLVIGALLVARAIRSYSPKMPDNGKRPPPPPPYAGPAQPTKPGIREPVKPQGGSSSGSSSGSGQSTNKKDEESKSGSETKNKQGSTGNTPMNFGGKSGASGSSSGIKKP